MPRGRCIKAGANVKAANQEGMTPLFLACQSGDAVLVGMLLDAGRRCERDARAR